MNKKINDNSRKIERRQKRKRVYEKIDYEKCKHKYFHRGTRRVLGMGYVNTYQCEFCGRIITT